MKSTIIPGYYRECEDPKCNKLVPCPYAKCQEHRDDFAVRDTKLESFDPKDVVITNG